LRVVANYTQSLGKRYKGLLDSDVDEFIEFAAEVSQSMNELIEALQAFSRAGITKRAISELSNEEALEDEQKNLRKAIAGRDAVINYDELSSLTMDKPQLVQVFQNLIANASKYRGAAVPHAQVSAAKNGSVEWIFAVRDKGMSIDTQKHYERIFVIFQRLQGREELNGAGIGLAICKKIVERHGGGIRVESQPGKGSTFYFVLRQGRANARHKQSL
jgi:light-regulated signal transduction histidine kinase (bacteriophytochrome)